MAEESLGGAWRVAGMDICWASEYGNGLLRTRRESTVTRWGRRSLPGSVRPLHLEQGHRQGPGNRAQAFNWMIWGELQQRVSSGDAGWFSTRRARPNFRQSCLHGFLGKLWVVVGLEIEPDLGGPADVAL